MESSAAAAMGTVGSPVGYKNHFRSKNQLSNKNVACQQRGSGQNLERLERLERLGVTLLIQTKKLNFYFTQDNFSRGLPLVQRFHSSFILLFSFYNGKHHNRQSHENAEGSQHYATCFLGYCSSVCPCAYLAAKYRPASVDNNTQENLHIQCMHNTNHFENGFFVETVTFHTQKLVLFYFVLFVLFCFVLVCFVLFCL
jgi:hypothetical protein